MPITIAIIAIIVSLIGGGAAGAIINAILNGCRDTRKRRSIFLGFLRQWQTEISLPHRGPDNLGIGYNPALDCYYSRLPSFKAEVERVRDAFADADKFESLTSRLGNLKKEDWQNKKDSDVILHALDELIAFVV